MIHLVFRVKITFFVQHVFRIWNRGKASNPIDKQLATQKRNPKVIKHEAITCAGGSDNLERKKALFSSARFYLKQTIPQQQRVNARLVCPELLKIS
jgi:cadmium resistance protein CadD (predicted permease)